MPYNGYSEEYLDRLENGSIPTDNKSFSKRKLLDSMTPFSGDLLMMYKYEISEYFLAHFLPSENISFPLNLRETTFN